jgi:hypothetical protein
MHADDEVLPTLDVVVPDGQDEQLPEPLELLKLPCGQSTQTKSIKENCCPMGQNAEDLFEIHASTSSTCASESLYS